MENPILNPSIPYIGLIEVERFAPQKLIRINGAVSQILYSFEINLQCGPNSYPKSDIALQVQVFVRLLNESIFVNSFRHGSWEEKLYKSYVPIKFGENFEIILLCTFDQYKIAINGQHYLDFPQRIRYDKISHLSIKGNVSITQISYESVAGLLPNFSSLSENRDNMRVYPTLPLHNLEHNCKSSCEELNFPTQSRILNNTSSSPQLNTVVNDSNIVHSDAHHVEDDKHFLKNIYLVIFAIIIITIITFFMLKNGKHIKF